MPLERVLSWRELDDALGESSWLRTAPGIRPATVFRGLATSAHRNCHSLSRLQEGFPELERHLLRNFRKYAHGQAAGPTTWDWLALAQHHGLPTRLLDWTHSPLVALHFATASRPDEEAVLWEVDTDGVHELLPARLRRLVEAEGASVLPTDLLAQAAPGLEELDELAGDGPPFLVFFEPPSLDRRIVAQAAVLSVASGAGTQVEAWLEEHPDLWRAWRIPPDVKAEVRRRLDQANVTERLLLPGLDGLARWLRRYYGPQADPGTPPGARMEEEADAQRDGTMSG